MTSAATWALIGACAAVTAAIKAAGPVALGGRDLPGWFTRVIALMAPISHHSCVATSTLPAEEAFRPIGEGGCALI